uniref:Zinc finger BED domain-containing protein 5 n=1 Tax=Caenorhabditis tropicalis TaxID=1561998 RepID=A0A1I7V0E5_9PELO
MNRGDKWIEMLENELRNLENQKECKCDFVWNEMHKMSFGNRVEKKFVEIINDFEDTNITECPLDVNETNRLLENASEVRFLIEFVF